MSLKQPSHWYQTKRKPSPVQTLTTRTDKYKRTCYVSSSQMSSVPSHCIMFDLRTIVVTVAVVIVTPVFFVLVSLRIGQPRMRMNAEGKFSFTPRTKSFSQDSLLSFFVKRFRNLWAIFSTFKNHLIPFKYSASLASKILGFTETIIFQYNKKFRWSSQSLI